MRTKKLIALGAMASVMSSTAMAGGFEKVTGWSARWSALGAAATAGVQGADALFFNPAGIGKMDSDHQISANISPTLSKFDGPIVTDNTEVEGENTLSPLFGVLFAKKINDKIGIGAGVYVAGGTTAKFENIEFGSAGSSRKELESNLALTEIALGGSYQLTNKLSVGAAWRIGLGQAALSSATDAGLIELQAKYRELEDEQFDGFKLGLQWTEEKWGLGLNWRSAMNFAFEGRGDAGVDGAQTGSATSNALVQNAFPEQYSLGGFYNFSPKTTIYSELTYTDYSANGVLYITSTNVNSSGAQAAVAAAALQSDIVQNWRDQWNIKFGLERMHSDKLTLRAGYAATTNVTPEGNARATFSTPGLGHTLTGGAGYVLNNNMVIDGALEYSFASGTGEEKSSTGTKVVTGEYNSRAVAGHISFQYNF